MSEEKETSQSHGKLKWHPAFLEAMQQELFDYLDSLDFKYEYQLVSEPLFCPVVIVNASSSMEKSPEKGGELLR